MQSSRATLNRSSTAHIEDIYKESMRMLNGLDKSLEKHLAARSMADLPESERRWTAQGESSFLNSEH